MKTFFDVQGHPKVQDGKYCVVPAAHASTTLHPRTVVPQHSSPLLPDVNVRNRLILKHHLRKFYIKINTPQLRKDSTHYSLPFFTIFPEKFKPPFGINDSAVITTFIRFSVSYMRNFHPGLSF